ncbi:low specificity L-threonine aldolase [Tropicibacter sp. R15_0]|uniref:threonine aldolase family protein n=1 Tax=Tropicibacter sp. R15_0 TaxID=2821101 RepID=UPI001ADA8E8F|nr:beta-eliminating lyase-related protein [Tropicibacter sp. R15_0]MBO9466892.1 low specificity L-threonine aldolase [Tropicibacter sp. R15_0]
MFFASDNSGPAHPAVLDALTAANTCYTLGYGNDDLTREVQHKIRDLFEAPEAAVYLVGTGTAANALALSVLCQPFETVFCATRAHIVEDECNAPEFYTGGAKLTLVGDGDQMTPAQLRAAIEAEENRGVHGQQRGAVSITNVAELGNTYSLAEMAALCDLAKEYNLPVHLDGARFSQACAALDCTPAEMSWKLDVDVAVFGGTKNGLMGVEAVVIFDPKRAFEFELRRKRGGHLFSKHRYLAAQMNAFLTDDLWLDLAQKANASAAQLYRGLQELGVDLITQTPANVIFFNLPLGAHKALQKAGAVYYLMGDETGPDASIVTGRLVCDWSIGSEGVEQFLSELRRVLR